MVDESSRQQLAEHAFEAGLHRWPVQPLGVQQRAQQRCSMMQLGDACCWHTECVLERACMLQCRGSHTHARVLSDGLGLWDKLVSVSVERDVLVSTCAFVDTIVRMSFVPGLSIDAIDWF